MRVGFYDADLTVFQSVKGIWQAKLVLSFVVAADVKKVTNMKNKKNGRQDEVYLHVHYPRGCAVILFTNSPALLIIYTNSLPMVEVNEQGDVEALNKLGRSYINKETKPVLMYIAKFFRKKIGFMQYATLSNAAVDGLFGEISKLEAQKRKKSKSKI